MDGDFCALLIALIIALMVLRIADQLLLLLGDLCRSASDGGSPIFRNLHRRLVSEWSTGTPCPIRACMIRRHS